MENNLKKSFRKNFKSKFQVVQTTASLCHNVVSNQKSQKTISVKKGYGHYFTARTRFFLDMRFSQGVRYQRGLFQRKISSKLLEPFLRYWQKTSKMPQRWGFPHLWHPRFFFKNHALSLLYPYGALTSCKKIRKTVRAVLLEKGLPSDPG